ncbi:MAG: S1C family serine protease [Phycisphaerae bacterium]
MRPRLLAAIVALLFVPAGIAFAAEKTKGAEPKAPPAVAPKPDMVAYLGVSTVPVGPELDHQVGLPRGVGLMVEGVMPDSPAAKAGILRYDVLWKLDDQVLIDMHQFRVLVWTHKPGDRVKLTYFRNGKSEVADATLGGMSRQEEMEAWRRLGEEIKSEMRHWGREWAAFGRGVAREGQKLGSGIKHEFEGHANGQAAAPPPANSAQPAPKAQTSMSVNIVTDKYAVTVNERAGQEYATVNTADGKPICKDLPQAKWNTLPKDVRDILNDIHLKKAKGGTERIKVEA